MAQSNVQRRSVAKIRSVPISITFVETDFNQKSWLDTLIEAGFDRTITTFILWEGVTMYLSEEAVLETLKLVATLPEGSEIAFDYFSREFINSCGLRLNAFEHTQTEDPPAIPLYCFARAANQ